jgi:hypothetical protein
MVKVILKFDVYRVINDQRFWERQVWIGEMPAKVTRSEYDPLVLLKEYEHGSEHILFRLDDFKADAGEVIYRPTILHHSDSFLKSLPKWGFKMQPIVNSEPV